MTIRKWKVDYEINTSDGQVLNKTTDVFGSTMFDAMANAYRIIKILERKSTILTVKVI